MTPHPELPPHIEALNDATPAGAARTYAASWGLAVHPLHYPVAAGRCSCGSDCGRSCGKHPMLPDWPQAASSDRATVDAWWAATPGANVGVAINAQGQRSRPLLHIDIDGPDGAAILAALEARHGALPPTLGVRSGRDDGGRHLFLRLPSTIRLDSLRSELRLPDLPGRIEVKHSGNVVVPPSVHYTGRRYQWEGAGSAADAPGWLLQLLRRPTSTATGPTPPQPSAAKPPSPELIDELADIIRARWPAEGTGHNAALLALSGALLAGAGWPTEAVLSVVEAAAPSRARPRPREALDAVAYTAAALAAGRTVTGWPALAGLVGDDAVDAAREALGLWAPRGRPQPPPPPPPPPADDSDSDDESWRGRIPVTKQGAMISCLPATGILVANLPELRGRLAWDERSEHVTWLAPSPWGANPGARWTDVDATRLAQWLYDREGYITTSGCVHEAVLAEAHRAPYDPVRDYLERLPPWDGRPRVTSWLQVYLGATPTPYLAGVGRAWLISAVARVYQPGCQADHLLVLEGPQGAGKSTALAILARPWHGDISVDPSDKDSAMAIQGLWIYEWGELSGLARRETEAVKGFLTRTHDRLRRPYARLVDDIPRRGVGAATTNELAWLQDSTGGRRYWPVRCGRIDLVGLEDGREQLWAEARALYRQGVPWWLGGDEEARAAEEQVERLELDPWEPLILDFVDAPGLIARPAIETQELLAATGLRPSDQNTGHARRLTRIMQRLGWKPAQIGVSKRRGWKRPAARRDDLP